VLAHVDRAWASSFRDGANPQVEGFIDVITQIMQGKRLGDATDKFNMRWAALSTTLSEALQKTSFILAAGSLSDAEQNQLKQQWVARDDARNYVLFGDPAVQLRSKDMPELSSTK